MKRHQGIGLGVMVATIVALATAGGIVAQIIAKREYNDSLRAHLYQQAASLGANIERRLVEAIEVSYAVRTFVAANPDIDTRQYNELAKGLRRDRDYLLNIAAAPNLVTKFVHPVEPNASVIGLDLNTSKAQREAAELARKVNRSVVAGPLDLIQGGSGFIIRTPVTIDEGAGQTRFWGIVSVVMSTSYLFDLAKEIAWSNVELAIRGRNGLGPSGDIVYGPQLVFDDAPVLYDVDLPYGLWQIGMRPVAGWNRLPLKDTVQIWAYTVLIAITAIAVVFVILRFKSRKDRAEGELAAAIESIEDGFAIFDTDDRLTLCNSRYRSIYDLPESLTTRGTPFKDLLKYGLSRGHYPEAEGREQEWLEERLDLHLNPAGSFNQLLRNGRWMKIAESKTENGMIVGFRVDITDLKNAQEAAERANQIKSQFLNNINHEMRTPLTVMLGYVPMLRDIRMLPAFQKFAEVRTKGENDNELTKFLDLLAGDIAKIADRIHSAGHHLLDLINDSLDLARIDAGQLKIDVKPVSLAKIVRSVASDFAQRLEASELELRIETVDFHVLADEIRLRQILINLIDNAIKFTDDGHITISAKPLDGKLVIEIADTGCGIPPKHLTHIFTEFYQGDSSTTRKYGGTGLGLAICRDLVELQGGSISVQSTVGAGTRFSITLPPAEPAQNRLP